MPLFSSSSVKEGASHHNKLGKSQHARASSIGGRKASIGGKSRVDEDASTKAIAGSQSRLHVDDSTGTDWIKPMTPKSLNGEHLRNQSTDQMELQEAPAPPPHEAGYIVTNDVRHDDTRRDSQHTNSTTTWRENPDASAMRNRGDVNDASTEMAGSGQRNDAHILSGNKAADLASARKKIQFAIEAELAADRALEVARKAVDEARTMVGALERQAHEEFERAHAKKMETAVMVKDLEKLGRHNH